MVWLYKLTITIALLLIFSKHVVVVVFFGGGGGGGGSYSSITSLNSTFYISFYSAVFNRCYDQKLFSFLSTRVDVRFLPSFF